MPKPKLPFKEFAWTPQLAYAIGLLTTDGNLSKDGRHITMRSSEPQLLKTFRSCLNLTTPVKESYHDTYANGTPCYRVQFSGVQFYRWLLTIGLYPRKTYTIGSLKIPDRYFADFLRGHLDGDGSVSTYEDRHNTYKNPKYVYTRLWVRFISVSRPHIQWLRATVARLLAVNGHLAQSKIYRPDQTVGMWTLKFGKQESIALLSWIYYRENLPCLKRKMIVAMRTIEKIKRQKTRKYVSRKNLLLPPP